jgi:hypothetical protein
MGFDGGTFSKTGSGMLCFTVGQILDDGAFFWTRLDVVSLIYSLIVGFANDPLKRKPRSRFASLSGNPELHDRDHVLYAVDLLPCVKIVLTVIAMDSFRHTYL